MLKKLILIAGMLVVAGASSAMADATIPQKDEKGTKDNRLLPRYEGSLLLSAKQQAYAELTLPLSPLEKNDKLDSDNNTIYAPKQSKTLEGPLTRLVYLEPDGRSPLEILRNYQEVVTAAGGETLFECKDEACGGSATRAAYGGGGDQSLTMQFVREKDIAEPDFSNGKCALTSDITDQHYFTGRLPVDGGDAFVAIQTFTIADGGNYCNAFNGRTIALVNVVEPKAREQKMVVVKAADMAKSIDASGKIALYGIFFDTDKADLKAESDPTLQEIATLLKSKPELKIVVVGHTDNQGGFDHNMDLSKRRAASVQAALVKRFQVDAARLKSAGVGMVAPAASNESEDGRAKNRRVEIVNLN
ncbi:OmpA family protein [Rhizobium sp. C4]|uniref:OmpA family protein n=1 Tax=Rhizobium sp. C4 TaxID=1349800 RepID=UPI001E53C864|nr:OmpA family protein [Rhizobium sp. C4]MCD2174472.1 OmpA family protein [Rhizobium sp. C4]